MAVPLSTGRQTFIEPVVNDNIPGETSPGFVCLTHRERQLTRAVARSQTNREIASELGLSVQTVKNTLSCVFGKLKLRSRVELAMWYARKHESKDALKDFDA